MTPQPVSVVTGGSVGIGADICRRLLDRRHRVFNLSNRPAAFDHPDLETVLVDLTDRDATWAAAAKIAVAHAVTRLVHCAGDVRPARIEDVTLADLDHLSELHVACAISLMQAFLPAMRAQSFGRVVLISTRGVLGLPTRTVYAATKAALIAMARTWALETAADGITVNAVAPGPIETDLFQAFVPDPERRRQIAEAVPVKRLGAPGDIGRVVAFLLDDESSFITGQTLFVCGGASVGTLGM